MTIDLTQLGNYRIDAEIGRGGMATVYRAFHMPLQRYVALKVLDPMISHSREFQQRFEQEARVAAQLSHPNIVPIYDLGSTDGREYIAMQLIDGSTLERRIHDGERMRTPQVLTLIAMVAEGLAHAHENGVIHRDVKPSNILLRPDEWPVLSDFGIARAVEGLRLTMSFSVMGTPRYMSPEQAMSQDVDHRTDIYSLGVVMYEMLAGQPPFIAPNTPSLLYMHVHEAPTPLSEVRPDLSVGVRELVSRCLAKAPGERFQNALRLAASCRALAAIPGIDEADDLPPPPTRLLTTALETPSQISRPVTPPVGTNVSQSTPPVTSAPPPVTSAPPPATSVIPSPPPASSVSAAPTLTDDVSQSRSASSFPPTSYPDSPPYSDEPSSEIPDVAAAAPGPTPVTGPPRKSTNRLSLIVALVVAGVMLAGWWTLGPRLMSSPAADEKPTAVAKTEPTIAPAAAPTSASVAAATNSAASYANVPAPAVAQGAAAAPDTAAAGRFATEAMAALGRRDFNGALEQTTAGLKASPNDPALLKAAVDARMGLGSEMLGRGALEDALRHYLAVRSAPLRGAASRTEIREADASAAYLWAALTEPTDRALALIEFGKAYRIDPAFRDVRQRYFDGNLAMAKQFQATGDLDSALRYANIAHTIIPDRADVNELLQSLPGGGR